MSTLGFRDRGLGRCQPIKGSSPPRLAFAFHLRRVRDRTNRAGIDPYTEHGEQRLQLGGPLSRCPSRHGQPIKGTAMGFVRIHEWPSRT